MIHSSLEASILVKKFKYLFCSTYILIIPSIYESTPVVLLLSLSLPFYFFLSSRKLTSNDITNLASYRTTFSLNLILSPNLPSSFTFSSFTKWPCIIKEYYKSSLSIVDLPVTSLINIFAKDCENKSVSLSIDFNLKFIVSMVPSIHILS